MEKLFLSSSVLISFKSFQDSDDKLAIRCIIGHSISYDSQVSSSLFST